MIVIWKYYASCRFQYDCFCLLLLCVFGNMKQDISKMTKWPAFCLRQKYLHIPVLARLYHTFKLHWPLGITCLCEPDNVSIIAEMLNILWHSLWSLITKRLSRAVTLPQSQLEHKNKEFFGYFQCFQRQEVSHL